MNYSIPCGNSKFKKWPKANNNPIPPAVNKAVCNQPVFAFKVKNKMKNRIMAGINPIITLNTYSPPIHRIGSYQGALNVPIAATCSASKMAGSPALSLARIHKSQSAKGIMARPIANGKIPPKKDCW